MLTRELRRPLGRAELEDLSEFLAATPKAMPFPEAHGFLTGIASAPTTIMPSEWQPEMLGEPRFVSTEQAQHVIGLVMRLYNQILTDLNEDNPLAPPNSDAEGAIRLWCTGYLKAARMDDVWRDDERSAVFLFPLAVLTGEVDLVGEEDSNGKVIEDPAPQLRRCREALDATVRDVNRYWTAWRRENAAPIAQQAHKVGRNEPCPCGSGLKFKKCCALKEH